MNAFQVYSNLIHHCGNERLQALQQMDSGEVQAENFLINHYQRNYNQELRKRKDEILLCTL
jgi:hypothetical protein